METPGQRIQIFAPFGEAYELTKRILFQPFDLGKWCVIGFAAFLAHLGGGSSFNFRSGLNGKGDWKFRSTSTNHALESFQGLPTWAYYLIAVVALLAIVVVLVLVWVRARGEFIFTDAVVRNRGAIVEPWKEFRREGNSLCLFRLVIAFISLLLVSLAGFPLWWPLVTRHEAPEGSGLIFGIILVVCVWLLVCLPLALATRFLPTIMYRQRCRAMEAFRQNIALLTSAPGPIILFFLFYLVLVIAAMIVMCALTCLTCCITAIPYIGTVILLPIFVFWRSFDLFFLRQFGADYDAWAVLPAAELTPAPPVQAPPPNEPPPLPE